MRTVVGQGHDGPGEHDDRGEAATSDTLIPAPRFTAVTVRPAAPVGPPSIPAPLASPFSGPTPRQAPAPTPTPTPTPTPAPAPLPTPTPTPTRPAPRPATVEIPALTGLRAVAAVWVLVHHLSFLPVSGYAGWFEPVAPLIAAGPLGVDLFFALSGFLLARSYLDRWRGAPGPRQALGFVWARVARVWPLYAVVVVLAGLWCAARAVLGSDGVITWQGAQPGLDPLSWLRQLTMTQMWDTGGIDGVSFVLPAWSISAEWAAYLAFPLLAGGAWFLRGRPRPVLAVLAVLAATPTAGVAVLNAVEGSWGGFWAVRLAAGFTAGMLTWLVVRRVPRTRTVSRWAHRLLLLALAEVAVVVYWAATAPATATLSADARVFLAAPLMPVVIGALALTDGPVARALGTRPLRHGGRISYALYLVHFLLIEMALVAMTRIPALAPDTAAAALLVPHLVVVSVALAHLAYRFVEEPAQVWMRDRDPSRRRVSARRDVVVTRRAEATLPSGRRAVGRRGGRHAARPAAAAA
ncbi:acyltransferase family protein [Actinomycetospora lemnae]|uniref:Acyltransferase n=1 Tax=Actinomycetospora lemnae TaxID=3019891 RepID=A0ABT5SV96_9PSEU|nr:acyltransferase [Actinomycetospora sp. DW7H6]MDD7966395.1 acyltransferase [Actinomycetospora sp. DW7H6]